MTFSRYAIFYTAPAGSLSEFGASWLGWDSLHTKSVAHFELPGFDTAEITKTPSKYGFHGTLKAPFSLSENTTEDIVKAAVVSFAKTQAPVLIDGLNLSRLRGFVALRPSGDTVPLNALATAVVEAFDMFRASPAEADLLRRRAAGLTPRQDAYLIKWGYPFVQEEFHFHMTLSGRLDPEFANSLMHALDPIISDIVPTPFAIDAITLMGEATDRRFHQILRVPLSG